jgi:TldD protein
MLERFDSQAILKRALRGGGEFADIFFEEGNSQSIVCEDGRVEKVLAGSDRGAGIRVIADKRTAYGYTNDVRAPALMELAETVSRAVRCKQFREVLAINPCTIVRGFPVRLEPDSVPTRTKVGAVTSAEGAARAFDRQIRQVRIVYRDGWNRKQVVNSDGDFFQWENTATVFMVQVVASNGEVIQTALEPVAAASGFELFDGISPEEIGLTAARRSMLMLNARKAPGGMMPVVLAAEAGGTMIHEAVGHGLEADLVQTGVSVYRDRIGDEVASPLVTVIDDATIPHARGSFPRDDEGTSAGRTVLVENGTLKGYLHDRLTAMKEGCTSTGNGRREGYHVRPIVRMSNTFIAPGSSTPADVIGSVTSGLLVKKMGGGQVNTVSGDFMFEVTEGYLIRNGEACEAVRGATLTGNGPEILKKIQMVANDIGFGIGTCGKDGQGVPVSDGQPTLLIASMTVGGSP